jgi:hypothetical protein
MDMKPISDANCGLICGAADSVNRGDSGAEPQLFKQCRIFPFVQTISSLSNRRLTFYRTLRRGGAGI